MERKSWFLHDFAFGTSFARGIWWPDSLNGFKRAPIGKSMRQTYPRRQQSCLLTVSPGSPMLSHLL